MEYNLVVLRGEIITFIVCFIYIFFYIFSKFFGGIFFISKLFVKNKKHIIDDNNLKTENNVSKVKLHQNDNFIKVYKISNDDKARIGELLKKIKLNISKSEFDIAKNLIIEGLTIDKFNIDLNIELAGIYILEKEYSKAEYIYKDLLLVHTDNFNIIKKLSYILSMQEKYDLSFAMYKKAYSINPKDLDVIGMLAFLSFYKQLYTDTIFYAKIFLKEKPRDVENLALLGHSYKNIGKIDDAVITYKRILDIHPYNEEIKNELLEIKSLDNN